MSEELKTIKELADELGVSKKKVENKLSYLKKKGNILGTVINGIRYLKQEEIEMLNISTSKAPETNKVPETNISNHSFNLVKEQNEHLIKELQEKNKHIEKLIDNEKSLQNLLDQQQRLALQDKKLLEEYKAEINDLKALKMPSDDKKKEQADNQPQEEVRVLKKQMEDLQEQLKEKDQELAQEKSKKWWQIWK